MSAPTLPEDSLHAASPATPVAAEPPSGARPSLGLFRKYATALMLLVGLAVIASGAVQLVLGYRESIEATGRLQKAEARTAEMRIAQYLDGLRGQVAELSALPWEGSALDARDRRDEFHRLMKLAPAIAEMRSVDAEGRERVRVSRIELDEVDSLRDAGSDPLVREARAHGAAFSSTYFRAGSEPFLALAVRDANSTGAVTIAEINLKFVGEVVRGLRVGKAGIVYVVDRADRIVAHPDMSLVLRKTDLSAYAPVRTLRGIAAGGGEPVGMIDAVGLGGEPVMLSAAYLAEPGWLVVVEQPAAEVLRPAYLSLANVAALTVIGLAAALVVSWFLARRLARPIVEMRRGAMKLAAGDLGARIEVRTGDEVESLARQFNAMADQLQDYTTGLERKVAEKTAELERANRHKSEFLANMSHELRTPLNAIIGFSEVLGERMFGELNAKQAEYVSDIHGSGEHLLSLINDILDLSKVEAGQMTLDPQPFDVRAAIANCLTLVRERAHRQKVRLASEVDREVGAWVADPRKFKQVALNLLSNAVKFTPAGGAVTVRARLVDDRLEVAVSDTGIGIASADQETIFTEFRQLRGAGARHEGTGLGLALSRRLVALHGGTLTVESVPGSGATFTMRLPRAPRTSA